MIGTRKKWVILSALMHAALLFGAGLASGPPLNPVQLSFSVSLLPSSPADLSDVRELAPPPGEDQAEKTVKTGVVRERKPPAAKRIVPAAAGKVISEEAKTGGEPHPEIETKPVEQRSSLAAEDHSPPSDLMEKPIEEDRASSGSRGLSPFSPYTPRFQPEYLAFAGEPASLVGVLGGAAAGGRIPARIISLPEPVYPRLSRRAGEEGRVVIEVRVGPEGRVMGAEVIKSSSHPRLDRAALEAVEKGAFQPAAEQGDSVESQVTVAYRFRLEEK